ncbi:MAG: hypothetical protein KatS3mg082_1436 [Nitrospiraceae bacterium]|nr:MAG: hypothetical protein KatS3mg082_1436 [Nitrospiraceae bacterium]
MESGGPPKVFECPDCGLLDEAVERVNSVLEYRVLYDPVFKDFTREIVDCEQVSGGDPLLCPKCYRAVAFIAPNERPVVP